ncbi:MAG TPA: RnfABCDGE type electron transport complex subunit D [Thermoanaerobacterales bacterium]|nr:RnfABCDGE type electron transport complex subunit D [Thermoanaerobacterales bacterium]
MDDFKLVVSSSPHINDADTIEKIMGGVVIALAPATLAGIYIFGFHAFAVIIVSVLSAVLTEWIFQKLRNKPVTINDGSAIVTGLLLALSLPPELPLWMAAVGSGVAIGLGKQVYGGLGHNPFNPALVGRAFLVASFPAAMTTWINPIDGLTGATPLGMLKLEGISLDYMSLLIGKIGGCIGETSVIAILIGALYLFYKDYIDWRIPVSYLATVAILTSVFGADPIFHLLSGGLMLGAFFMATDMVTSPITPKGKLIFGIGAGIVVVVIRLWGGLPEGVSYSILMMNGITPLINRFTRPRIFGKGR